MARGVFTPAVLWPPRVAQRALVRTLAEVARGLLHMHRRGVLHGDIKVGLRRKGGAWSEWQPCRASGSSGRAAAWRECGVRRKARGRKGRSVRGVVPESLKQQAADRTC